MAHFIFSFCKLLVSNSFLAGHAFDYSVSTVLILCLQVIMYHSDFLVLKS